MKVGGVSEDSGGEEKDRQTITRGNATKNRIQCHLI